MISAEISPAAVVTPATTDDAASGFEAGGGAMICTLMTSAAADTDALRDRAAGRAATGSFADKS